MKRMPLDLLLTEYTPDNKYKLTEYSQKQEEPPRRDAERTLSNSEIAELFLDTEGHLTLLDRTTLSTTGIETRAM